MSEGNGKPEFVQAQYDQYWEMMRFHLSLSWNIPTLAIAAVVAFIAFDPEKVTNWSQNPLLPATTLLVSGLFVVLMFIHNHRNLVFAGIYEKAITELEQEYGVAKTVHHHQLGGSLKGLAGISSSRCLSGFLLILGVTLLLASGYFWFLVIL